MPFLRQKKGDCFLLFTSWGFRRTPVVVHYNRARAAITIYKDNKKETTSYKKGLFFSSFFTSLIH